MVWTLLKKQRMGKRMEDENETSQLTEVVGRKKKKEEEEEEGMREQKVLLLRLYDLDSYVTKK